MVFMDEQNTNRDRLAANALKAWQRTLANEPETARRAIAAAMTYLNNQRVWHWTELAQFKAQMQNGFATPGDFGVNDATGAPKRA